MLKSTLFHVNPAESLNVQVAADATRHVEIATMRLPAVPATVVVRVTVVLLVVLEPGVEKSAVGVPIATHATTTEMMPDAFHAIVSVAPAAAVTVPPNSTYEISGFTPAPGVES